MGCTFILVEGDELDWLHGIMSLLYVVRLYTKYTSRNNYHGKYWIKLYSHIFVIDYFNFTWIAGRRGE